VLNYGPFNCLSYFYGYKTEEVSLLQRLNHYTVNPLYLTLDTWISGEVLHHEFVLFFSPYGHQSLTPSDSGCLFTCGDGSFGQLGHGDYQSSISPVEVSFFRSKPADQIACGMRHSLALLKGNTSLICFHIKLIFWSRTQMHFHVSTQSTRHLL